MGQSARSIIKHPNGTHTSTFHFQPVPRAWASPPVSFRLQLHSPPSIQRTVTPMYSKPYVFGPKVFELISYRMYSPTLCIRCRCYSMDGYSRSGCKSLASHRNCMCLSLSLSILVIVLLLTVISAETSAAASGKNGSFAIKVSCIICSTLSGKRNFLQRRPFGRCTVEHSVEVAQ